jgi:hypothetical protein
MFSYFAWVSLSALWIILRYKIYNSSDNIILSCKYICWYKYNFIFLRIICLELLLISMGRGMRARTRSPMNLRRFTTGDWAQGAINGKAKVGQPWYFYASSVHAAVGPIKHCRTYCSSDEGTDGGLPNLSNIFDGILMQQKNHPAQHLI